MTPLADYTHFQLLEARGVIRLALALDESKLSTPYGQRPDQSWRRARVRRQRERLAELQAELERRGSWAAVA